MLRCEQTKSELRLLRTHFSAFFAPLFFEASVAAAMAVTACWLRLVCACPPWMVMCALPEASLALEKDFMMPPCPSSTPLRDEVAFVWAWGAG